MHLVTQKIASWIIYHNLSSLCKLFLLDRQIELGVHRNDWFYVGEEPLHGFSPVVPLLCMITKINYKFSYAFKFMLLSWIMTSENLKGKFNWIFLFNKNGVFWR